MSPQLMIITFIMTSRLEEKLLLNKARKFSNNINGINSFSISLLNKDDFPWHREELKRARAINSEVEKIHFEQPVKERNLVETIVDLLDITNKFTCYFFYEGVVSVCVHGNDFSSFLISMFKLNDTYDLSLIFKSPDRVFIINDDEYSLDIYYRMK